MSAKGFRTAATICLLMTGGWPRRATANDTRWAPPLAELAGRSALRTGQSCPILGPVRALGMTAIRKSIPPRPRREVRPGWGTETDRPARIGIQRSGAG